MTVLAIIQARMGSSRLPGKMMLSLASEPILRHVIERVKRAKTLDIIVLATSDKPEDDLLEEVALKSGIETFRGDEKNLFKRFYDCVKCSPHAETVVRVCADNPFISPEAIDYQITDHLNGCNYEYSTVDPYSNWINGVGVEVASRSLFHKLNNVRMSNEEKEHCLIYVWNHREEFSVNFQKPGKFAGEGKIKLDLDTLSDYERLKKIAGNDNFEKVSKLDVDTIKFRFRGGIKA